jgi:hypothetical protein
MDRSAGSVLDTIEVNYNIDLEEFSLFDNLNRYARIPRPSVAITSGDNNIAFGEPVDGNDSIRKAVFTHVNNKDEYTLVRVYASNTQRLDTGTVDGEVPYYIFSHEVGKKKYFLNVDRDSVRWVYFPDSTVTAKLLKSTKKWDDPSKKEGNDPYALYKFALPKFEDGVYLQTLDTVVSGKPRVIKFKGGGSLDLAYARPDKDGEGIFSALDLYKEAGTPTSVLAWKFEPVASNEWVSIGNAFFGKDGTATGVLSAVDYTSGTVIGPQTTTEQDTVF